MAWLFRLQDEHCARMKLYLALGEPVKPRIEDRRAIKGTLLRLNVGCRWQEAATVFGLHTTIYTHYNRWSQRGLATS
ncbi:transposase [Methylorubrum rhodesianum]|uniref:transposase n=1 Tax=Methylorubrum rhodesianum TaxID=29427 RepID=UPI0035E40573